MQKPRLNFWQIWNMSFGFLGIQFGWGLQMANMSAIYEYLGAKPDQIPMLWLAAPLTGLLVQPIIGSMSDRTWGKLGRRRPYFLVGALLSSAALCVMPNSPTLWIAAGLLWILDASINVTMEPFRAFVADLLPDEQRTRGFAMQSLFIGLGAVIASSLPWMMTNLFGVAREAGGHAIPASVRYSFYVGAAAFLVAVLWTIVTTREYPPEDMEAFEKGRRKSAGLFAGLSHTVGEVGSALRDMPATMRQLAPVQFFTWLGLFCMWLYLPGTVARHVFGAPDASSPLFTEGIEWNGLMSSVKDACTFAFAFALPAVAARLGRKATHSVCLVAGALGLLAIPLVGDKWWMLPSMVGVGIAWASILSMPYAIVAGSLPSARIGVYMGIFNFFIVIPEILAAAVLGKVVEHALGNRTLPAVVLGGASILIAALLTLRVEDPEPAPVTEPQAALAA
jgi:maltose/moltooligosaccharide transporter